MLVIALAGVLLASGSEPACTFKIQAASGKPKVVGPEEIVPHVYFVQQPDSPVEVVALDLSESLFIAELGKVVWEPRYRVRVRNRSNQAVKHGDFFVMLATTKGGIGGSMPWRDLAPGEEKDVKFSEGRGTVEAPNDEFWILVGIKSVAFVDCTYWPSMSIPRGVPTTVWR